MGAPPFDKAFPVEHTEAERVVHPELYGGTAHRARSPLIGREAAIAELRGLYGRACARTGSIVLLWGEAGVGKTRLLDEFVALATSAGARAGSASCFQDLCPPFAPLREAFSELSLPTPFEVAPAGASPSEAQAKRYRDFVAAAAALATSSVPTLLGIDDLQWADFATLEFLAFLAHRLKGANVVVLAAVRSEHLEVDHLRLEALEKILQHGARRLDVEPLGDDAMRLLVSTLWPGEAPLSEVERVCALAEGKPYFAEELVNSAVVARDAPRYEAVPLSIRAGMLARFEQLPEEARHILLRASVIGRNFDPLLLQRLANAHSEAVVAALVRARDLQLVREVGRTGAFSFRHAITREILYRELPAFAARAIHRELAVLLQSDEFPTDAADVAHHWSAGGDRSRATRAHELVGDRAIERHAHADAEAAYRSAAATRAETDPTYPELCDKLSRALSISGNLTEACAMAQRAVDGYAAAGEPERAAALSIRLARRHFEAGRPADANEAARLALRLCKGQSSIAYDTRVTLAHFAALQGKFGEAAEQLHSAELVAGDHPKNHRRNFYVVRAVTRAASGQLRAAFVDYQHAIDITRELGDPEQLAWVLSNYASRAISAGYTAPALGAYREAVEKAPPNEFGKVGAVAAQGLAYAHLLAGELGEAHLAHERGRQSTSSTAHAQIGAIVTGLRLAYLGGEPLDPDPPGSTDALATAFGSGETQEIGLLAGCVAAQYDAAGRQNDAAALRTRALATLTSVDLSLWLLDQLASSDDAGERRKARSLLAEAATDADYLAARAHLVLFDARIARRERKTEKAKRLASEAATRFEAIGWPWERAAAMEVAGRYAEAAAIYERHGYVRQQRELEVKRRRTRHRAGSSRLTPRELEVTRLAAEGKTNREIATALFISERTVETHIAAIFDRFDFTSRRQLGTLVPDSGSSSPQ
jgi:DNA-binding CsgD family transcriptional regulator/tetratricopeptide (TPR) repeat protein